MTGLVDGIGARTVARDKDARREGEQRALERVVLDESRFTVVRPHDRLATRMNRARQERLKSSAAVLLVATQLDQRIPGERVGQLHRRCRAVDIVETM